jgi:hypothetical protein
MAKRGFGGLKASLRRLSGANLMSKGALNQAAACSRRSHPR